MKILNEKGLIHFSRSGAPPDKEGYLMKKGELNKGFQKRWFILKGNLLFYFDHKGDREPIGVIILEGYTIELAAEAENFMFVINFAQGTRSYFLCASSQESMESWMKALSCAGYEYVKIMVSELQSKLEEVSANTEANIVHNAERDSRLLDHAYNQGKRSVSWMQPKVRMAQKRSTLPLATKSRINPFNNLDLSDEVSPGDASHPVSSVSAIEIVTWSLLGVSSFKDMHNYVKSQVEEPNNDIANSEDNL